MCIADLLADLVHFHLLVLEVEMDIVVVAFGSGFPGNELAIALVILAQLLQLKFGRSEFQLLLRKFQIAEHLALGYTRTQVHGEAGELALRLYHHFRMIMRLQGAGYAEGAFHGGLGCGDRIHRNGKGTAIDRLFRAVQLLLVRGQFETDAER